MTVVTGTQGSRMSEDAAVAGLRLDDQLCFALYAATNAITRRYRPRLAEIGLTYPQYLVMLALWQDGAATVGRLAQRLELESHAVSPVLDRLVGSGLVTRRPGVDRRQVVVDLTGPGRALEARAAQVQADVVCDTALDPSALAELRRELRALAARLAPDAPACSHPARSATTDRGEAP